MITFYITSDSSSGKKELFVMRAENGQHRQTGPFYAHEIAWRQCENAAHAAAERRGGRAEYTVTPEDVTVQARDNGAPASSAAWVVS